MTVPLKLLIVDPDDIRRERLSETLRADPTIHAVVVKDTFGVHALVQDFQPDMIIVASQTAARDAIEDLRAISSGSAQQDGRPIALLVDRLSAIEAEDALRAGVSAYVAENLDLARIRMIMDLATAQFRVFGQMRRELERARADLTDRKVIDRAKGLIMKHRKIDEDAAYKLLRSAAMNQGRPIIAISRDLIAAQALLED
jgi:two-component system, response regulator / RNA-binding antiterminator